jgi:hypothetical protein
LILNIKHFFYFKRSAPSHGEIISAESSTKGPTAPVVRDNPNPTEKKMVIRNPKGSFIRDLLLIFIDGTSSKYFITSFPTSKPVSLILLLSILVSLEISGKATDPIH